MLLKNHTYLAAYDSMSKNRQKDILHQTKTLYPLTDREKEVLELILSGKSNRQIAGTLFITESTVKTHTRNIYSKYDVGSRAELISTILKNQSAL
jgi:DNA-binding NarL/FixJ family response regulator